MTQLSLEKKWLQKGLAHPGGMIPLLTEKGEPVDSKLIEIAFLNGWIELLPSARDGACFVGCRLTQSGRDFLEKGASAVKSPAPPQGRRKQGVSKSAALLSEMLQSSKSRLATSVAERQLPPSRTMSMVFLLALIPAVGLSIYMLYPSQSEEPIASETSATAPGDEGPQTAAAAAERSAPGAVETPSAGQAPTGPAGTPVARQEGYWQNIVSLMMNDRATQQDGAPAPSKEGSLETASAAPADGQSEETAAAPEQTMMSAAEDNKPSGEDGGSSETVALPPEKPEVSAATAQEPDAQSPAETSTQVALAELVPAPEPAVAETPDQPPEPLSVPDAPPAPSEETVVVAEASQELPAAEPAAAELPAAPAVPGEEELAEASLQLDELPAEPAAELAPQEPEPGTASTSVLATEPAALSSAAGPEIEAVAETVTDGETELAQSELEAPAVAVPQIESSEAPEAPIAPEPMASSEETIQLAEAAEEPAETPETSATESEAPQEPLPEPLVREEPDAPPVSGPDDAQETVVAATALETPAAQETGAPETVSEPVLTIDREQPRSDGLAVEPEQSVAALGSGSIERVAAASSVTDWTPDRSTPALDDVQEAKAVSSAETASGTEDEAATAGGSSSALRQVQLAILPPLKPTPPAALPDRTLASVPKAATAVAAPEPGLPRAGYTVQFVSLDSEEAAKKAAGALTAELGALLGPRSLYVIKAQVSGKTYYRVRVKAEMTREEAGALCQESKSSGQDCFVSRNEA